MAAEDNIDSLVASLDAPKAETIDSRAPVSTVSHELGPHGITVSRVLTVHTFADGRVESGVRSTFANGESFSHCAYDSHLDRLAEMQGKANPLSEISRLSRVPANEGYYARQVREARLLYVLRVDRKAPPHMIEHARLGLEGAAQIILAAQAEKQAAKNPPSGPFAAMSPGVRFAAKAGIVLFLASRIATNALTPHVPPAPPASHVKVMGPGAAMLANDQRGPILEDENAKRGAWTSSERVRYGSTTTHVSGSGKVSTTYKPTQITVTTRK